MLLRRSRLTGILKQATSSSASTSRLVSQAGCARQSQSIATTAASTSTPSIGNDVPFYGKGKEREKPEKKKATDVAAETFEKAGLNPRLSLQLTSAFSSIRSPTAAQLALLAAMSQENDVILRAHTGTGKSFALLLGLLNKPRLVVQDGRIGESSSRSKRITSIVVVPSQELAIQYQSWAKQLFPKSMHQTLPSVVSVLYRDKKVSVDEHLQQISMDPPHVLVITATLFNDMLRMQKGPPILGISTLRTLVLDEVDSLFDLPGRFPSQKVMWNFLKHPPDALQAVNIIMKDRSTYSGGEPLPSAGLETEKGGINPDMRRRIHQGNDMLHRRSSSGKGSHFVVNVSRGAARGERPLQLIAVSATANSVLRNFLGAKTGWLRTGLRDESRKEMGKWLDLTGLSKGVNKGIEAVGLEELSKSGWALQVPKEIKHSCVIVDEPTGDGKAFNWRPLNPALARRGQEEAEEEESVPNQDDPKPGRAGPLIVAPTLSPTPTLDEYLLTCLAFLYASQPVSRGLALIPATWSLMKTRAYLAQLDVPVRFLHEQPQDDDEAILYLIQGNSARGLDFPGGLSHVFCVGIDSVRDETNYTHLAGRAARIGQDKKGSHQRPVGHVISIVRGLSKDQVRKNRGKIDIMASSELKLSLIYKRLGVRVDKLKNLAYDEVMGLEEKEEGGNIEDADAGAASEADIQTEAVRGEEMAKRIQVDAEDENGRRDRNVD